MGRPAIDITGKVYDTLTVIQKIEQRANSGELLWELLCDCGETCYATSSSLRRGRRNFCSKCRDEVSVNSPLKGLYANYKRGATKRGYIFDLDINQFKAIITSDCSYCGEPPNQWYKKEKAKEGLHYNGIDRVDNAIGYTIENVTPCCKYCNMAKQRFHVDDFTAWLDRVAERRNKY